jgi:hypothetical protein
MTTVPYVNKKGILTVGFAKDSLRRMKKKGTGPYIMI